MELHAQLACAMPRELARKGVTWQERAVYIEAVLYCRENLTDGFISRGELPFWMPDMSPKARAVRLDALAATGALMQVKDGWRFPAHVWEKWNPTKAQVDEKRAEEARRKADWRERRRRESQESPNGTNSGQRVTATECPRQPEPEPEPEPLKKELLQHPPLSSRLAAVEDDPNQPPPEERRRSGGGIWTDVKRERSA